MRDSYQWGVEQTTHHALQVDQDVAIKDWFGVSPAGRVNLGILAIKQNSLVGLAVFEFAEDLVRHDAGGRFVTPACPKLTGT